MQDRSHPLVVLMEDDLIHTPENPFCSIDPSCGCHEDQDLWADVAQDVTDGLLTVDEATRLILGQQL